jgi:hypothetical protein
VQGEGAALEIARAMAAIGKVKGVDVVIVGRGGGSIEDLWAFNEEVVARAIAGVPCRRSQPSVTKPMSPLRTSWRTCAHRHPRLRRKSWWRARTISAHASTGSLIEWIR